MRQPILALAPVLLAAGVLAGCGDGDAPRTVDTGPSADEEAEPDTATTSPTSPGPTSAGPTPTAAPPATAPAPSGEAVAADLTVTVDDGAGASSTWTLTCAPAGGDHPEPDAACAALAGGGVEALSSPSRDAAACTQIYGGPQTARVSGTVGEAPVTAELGRTDGCQIDRWDALVPLLPQAADTDA